MSVAYGYEVKSHLKYPFPFMILAGKKIWFFLSLLLRITSEGLASTIKEPMQFIKEEIKQFCLEIMWLLFPPRKSTRINYKDSRILSKLSDIMGCKVSYQKPIVFYRLTVKFGLWELKDGSLLNITKILYIKLIKCMQDLYAENWKEK